MQSLLPSPQEHAADVYLAVRLEAGTMHEAKYLIRTAFYFPAANIRKKSIHRNTISEKAAVGNPAAAGKSIRCRHYCCLKP